MLTESPDSQMRPVVMITGASAGIGAALAVEYARQGYSVSLLARRLEQLESVLNKIELSGGRGIIVQCDVTQPESVKQAAQETLNKLGRIDCVIANAGFGVVGPVEKLSLEDFH